MTPRLIRKVDQRALGAVRLAKGLHTRVMELARRLSESPERSGSSGGGAVVLLTGPVGKGKTMAASILAKTLGKPLYRVDMGAVVSRYIGETEKNLERVLAEAEQMEAALLLDEADALLGKRTEVRDSHDRYANVEVGSLLDRLERHTALVVLATNLRHDELHPAVAQRAAEVVEVPADGTEDEL